MRTLLLLAACLSCAAASRAQTTPAPGSAPAVSSTKNVGADRADAPQAPGMGAPGPAHAAPAQARRAPNRRRPATPAKAPVAPAAGH